MGNKPTYCRYKFFNYERNKYNLFRIVVVTCSVLATVYYGYECTKKYISDPITVSDEMVPLDSLPPLQMSICKQVHLTDCTIQDHSNYYFSLFDKHEVIMNDTDDYECYYDYDTDYNEYYYDYDTTTNFPPPIGKYRF